MKYIRTKDKIFDTTALDKYISVEPRFIIVENQLIVLDLRNKNAIKNHGEVVKQADTIEELCDAFVWQGIVFEGKIKNNCLIEPSYEELETPIDTEMIKEGIYGAIWTDKGLIFVARMNNKGELELWD